MQRIGRRLLILIIVDEGFKGVCASVLAEIKREYPPVTEARLGEAVERG